MPRNDYRCRKHGIRELWFESDPPRKCPKCGGKLEMVIAPNQFKLGGDMTVLDEPTRRGVQLQTGVRVETRDDLRALERKRGLTRIDTTEMFRTSSPTWGTPKSPERLASELVQHVAAGIGATRAGKAPPRFETAESIAETRAKRPKLRS